MAEALERAYYDLILRLKEKNHGLKIALAILAVLLILLLAALINPHKSK